MTFNFIFENIGIILNLIGTILIAFSFGSYPDKNSAPYTINDQGGKKYIAYFNYPNLFKIGIALLLLGFISQLFT